MPFGPKELVNNDSRIYIAGARGLVGSAIRRRLAADGCRNLLAPSSAEVDLTDAVQTRAFMHAERPEYVFFAAAKVGGIRANATYPADFIYRNLMMQLNLIQASHETGVTKLLFLGSSCIYPRLAAQPMAESELLSGYLEETNKPYALAKIAGIVLCQSFNRQYGTRFISAMPTNLYGIGDSYHPENSHVIPGLIRRFHEAKMRQEPVVDVWGSGKPLREFLSSDDLADACVFLMNHYDGDVAINVGSGQEVSIAELAALIRDVIGFEGDLRFDASKPDGTPRKYLDCTMIHDLGWRSRTPLREGLVIAYEDFLCRSRSSCRP